MSTLTADLDIDAIRAEFPVLDQEVGGHPLAYLDSAASSQKPKAVIDAISNYYTSSHANVHRGVHHLSQIATVAFENARKALAGFLNAPTDRDIVFTRGTTEAINLVANTWGQANIGAGDEIIVSHMEHHSNIVPWQMLCQRTGAVLKVIPVLDDGTLDMDAYAALLTERTKLVAVVHVSNSLGTVNPVAEIIRLAHDAGAVVLLDGAQATPHTHVDVTALDVDFYALSAHKMYGPTGIGALYGRTALLESMPPWEGGGDMIKNVSFSGTTYAPPPARFEAGTPNIAGTVGLHAAIDWINRVGINAIAAHEHRLLTYGTELLSEIPSLRILGTAPNKAGVITFTFGDAHPHDVGTLLNEMGIAIRTGHHCTEPLWQRFGVPATARASFAAYSTLDEVDRLASGLRKAGRMLGA